MADSYLTIPLGLDAEVEVLPHDGRVRLDVMVRGVMVAVELAPDEASALARRLAEVAAALSRSRPRPRAESKSRKGGKS